MDEREDRVNILLVDDQPENLVALEAVLGGLGERLVAARSGRDALRRLLEDDFAVILLDVQMPEMDGFETAALIRQRDRSKNTPIIFVTAYSRGEADVARGYSVGAVDYIFKPLVPEILRSKVAVFADLFRKTMQVQRLAESLKQRTLELESANKDLESFSYSVSHDLRAPLRAICGFAEIVARRHRESLDQEGRHYMDNILEAGARMGQLIDDLLAYSRLGRTALRHQQVPLRPLLERVIDSMALRVAETGAEVDLPEDLPAVPGDTGLLERVLGNLIQNALAYRRPDVPLRVGVSCEAEPDHFLIRVRDNGIGIAPEHHERIFQVFQRLHGDDHPGSGIGLAIVRKSVRLMGGEVWVESAEGEGSTFCVRLPRSGCIPRLDVGRGRGGGG